jgi:hypothetical protein
MRAIQDEWTNAGLTASQRYAKRNASVLRQRHSDWTAQNKDHVKTYSRENARKNRAKLTQEERMCRSYRKNYKLTLEQITKKFEEQDYKCGCCSQPVELFTDCREVKGVVDHCHTTGKIRDILCITCNVTLGLVYENRLTLQQMDKYLEKHNGE